MKHLTVLHKIFSSSSSFKGMWRNLMKIVSILLLWIASTAILQAQENIINVGENNTAEVISIPKSGHTNTTNYTITGTTTVKTIVVKSGYQGEITLRNLNITSSKTLSPSSNYGMSGVSCITVEGEYNGNNLVPITKVEVILDGNSTLTYTVNNAGCAFQVNQGAQIHINSIDRNDNTKGKLTATTSGTGSAGIGAPYFISSNYTGQGTSVITNGGGQYPPNRNSTAGGNIIIGSGTVVAKANAHGAGIGGAWYTYYNGIIIVYGGDVSSTSGMHAAGIGSGCPQGRGVMPHYASNSMIVALPPSKIVAKGDDGDLAGAGNKTYMNDPNRSTITVRTEDNEKNADIYIDMSESMATTQIKLAQLLSDLGINYDLKKVRIGRTGDNGLFVFNAEFKDKTTFFTDASSTFPGYEGRPYMPKDVQKIEGTSSNKVEVILERLKTDIAFTDYPSIPLEVGYTTQQAWDNAHRIKISYNDNEPMSNLTFKLQDGAASNFTGMKFLAANGTTEVQAPTTLNKGNEYYIALPIVQGKPIGIYSDVLLINGKWKNVDLPGYIRRIGLQRVVKNDTGINNYIKVTANPNKFVDDTYPATKTVELTLNIDHKDTGIVYDPLDVTAKYLITTEKNYDAALAATPLSSSEWVNMNIPANNAQNQTTTVSFGNKQRNTYYIHWYVTSGVVYAHSQTVTVPPSTYGGFGPYVITEPVEAGILSGNPSVCKDQIPSEIIGEASTGGSGNFSYRWETSLDGTTNWTTVGGNTQNYTPIVPLTTSPTYFRRITIDNLYGGEFLSNVFAIHIVSDGLTLHWNRNAADNNWNNPANWTNEAGVAQNMVPVSCTNVYIPGGITNYPSLHPDKTPVNIYGTPICNNITFAYGAELIYQHKLTYQKAYIQYNWGYYGNLSGVNYGDQPSGNACSPAPVQKREAWYALAAPLKSMATGDFAFVGYPLTWQAGFALSNPSTGNKGGEIEVGDFEKKFSTNDVPLSETNNAIAVKVALYRSIIGYSDHCNLEGLKGIIEIPYFENASKSAYYPGHIYDRFTKESKFFYFNPQTLQLLHSPVGKMKRGDEAYRFIYEENGVAANINVSGVPSIVPGYKQKVKRQNSTSLKVMIGNPFMASINAKQFFDVNSNNKLEESAGYQLFDSNSQTWKQYSYSAAGNIPPLQAFIVTLKSSEVELLFPLEGVYALTGTASSSVSPGQGRSLYLKSQSSLNLEGDYSILATPEADKEAMTVKKMISSEGHATPETFFISSNNKDYNLIQAYEKDLREIGIGVKTSDTKSTQWLKFENVDKFYITNGLRPVLIDKYLGIKQDLTVNNIYSFTQRQLDSKVKYVDADRFVLSLLSSGEELQELEAADINIVYSDKKLEVKALQNIKEVQIYDPLGRQVYSDTNVNTNYYTKSLSLTEGVYVVKVYTENGRTKADKIMIQ
ncbi:T9SS sorting signal type C domain-containing protein [Dysgonomonas sp.]